MVNLFLVLFCYVRCNTTCKVALCLGGMISHHLHGKHFGAIHNHLLSGLLHVSQLDFLLPALPSYSFYPHSIQSILKCTEVRSWHSSLQWPPISFRIQVKRPHKGLLSSPQAVSAPTPQPCLSALFPVLSLWPPCYSSNTVHIPVSGNFLFPLSRICFPRDTQCLPPLQDCSRTSHDQKIFPNYLA